MMPRQTKAGESCRIFPMVMIQHLEHVISNCSSRPLTLQKLHSLNSMRCVKTKIYPTIKLERVLRWRFSCLIDVVTTKLKLKCTVLNKCNARFYNLQSHSTHTLYTHTLYTPLHLATLIKSLYFGVHICYNNPCFLKQRNRFNN